MVLGSELRRGNGRGAAAVAVFVLAVALTACSDDSGGADSAPPAPSVRQSTSERPPSPTAPADPAAAEQEIERNWEKFFDPAVSQKDKQQVLENGGRMAEVLESFNGDQRGRQVQANVEKVEFTSPAGADVTYSLTLKGATALPGASGTAVEQDGTWKVSVKTLCALVQLSGNASPGPGC
ncbi:MULTISPECIES: hypothetical protein [Streptomyces]|uniref:Low molecular weight antigen MTB12-like C-terminal domain-containing protein n=1 Tax=Streptomyces dengpaensis TaxID=2049881 RepID=A0ABN5I8R7_9ACTN|nr:MULTISPECIES: hypothetical protein [Streptomyces]AVH59566.1 hypothetical protein C4B68_31755 [Streptomyces dengpaensis]PIB06833.1 hypothetical protein B1C81_22430 [Streptomyces sp. HG99]